MLTTDSTSYFLFIPVDISDAVTNSIIQMEWERMNCKKKKKIILSIRSSPSDLKTNRTISSHSSPAMIDQSIPNLQQKAKKKSTNLMRSIPMVNKPCHITIKCCIQTKCFFILKCTFRSPISIK